MMMVMQFWHLNFDRHR